MKHVFHSDYASLDLATVSEWTTVLDLATRWRFPSIRSLAIARLHPLLLDAPPLDRLITARACDIDAWVQDALDALVERSEPLTEHEAGLMNVRDEDIVNRFASPSSSLFQCERALPVQYFRDFSIH